MAEMLENKRFYRTQSKNATELITEDTIKEFRVFGLYRMEYIQQYLQYDNSIYDRGH